MFSNHSGMPLGGNKIDNGRRGPIAASRLFDNGSVFGVRGRRSATPLFFCEKASARKSAVVTSLCRRSPKCALLRRKLQLISPHVFTCHAVAACSNASTRFSRHVFRDREHSPSSASLQG